MIESIGFFFGIQGGLISVAFLLAEKFLESVEGNQNYPILLLHVVDKADSPAHIRVSAAVMFKNYIKRNWRVVCMVHHVFIQLLGKAQR